MLNRVEPFIQDCSGSNPPNSLQTYSTVRIETTMFAQTIACRCGALWEHFRKIWLAPVTSSCVSSPTTSTESWLKRAAVAVTIWKRCSKQISRGLVKWLRCWTLGINLCISRVYGPSMSNLWLPRLRLRPRLEYVGIIPVFRNSDHLHFFGRQMKKNRWRQYRSAYFTLLKHFFRRNMVYHLYVNARPKSAHVQFFPNLSTTCACPRWSLSCQRMHQIICSGRSHRAPTASIKWSNLSVRSTRKKPKLGAFRMRSKWNLSCNGMIRCFSHHKWTSMVTLVLSCAMLSRFQGSPWSRRWLEGKGVSSWYGSWTPRAMAVFGSVCLELKNPHQEFFWNLCLHFLGVRLHVHGTSTGTFNEAFYRVGLQV